MTKNKHPHNFLDSFTDYEKKTDYLPGVAFGLERVSYVLNAMGNPERGFRSVLVGGTKGKGSTVAILASIIKEAGYRVGTFTSPHLIDIRERIRVNGSMISCREWETTLDDLRGHLDKCEIPPCFGALTYFEVLTLAAILFFSKCKVDLGIFEVGLGGRLDATNVLEPIVSVLTPISRDHCALLGHTLSKIAHEKAAIIRKESFTVLGAQRPGIRAVLARRGSRFFEAGENFGAEDIHCGRRGSVFSFSLNGSSVNNLSLPLLGSFQVDNASCAIAAASILKREFSFNISHRDLRRGLRKVCWPGRLHIISRKPLVIADGAHNQASMRALVESLNRIFPKKNIVVVMGISKDKEVDNILKELRLLRPAHFIATRSNHPRALSADILARAARRYFKKISICSSLSSSLSLAQQIVKAKSSLFLITGSLFLVGEALSKLKVKS